MDCCSPHISPHLVVQGLRPLEPLDNALVRVQVLFEINSPILDIEYRVSAHWFAMTFGPDPWINPCYRHLKPSASMSVARARSTASIISSKSFADVVLKNLKEVVHLRYQVIQLRLYHLKFQSISFGAHESS